jgi:hypothetical protein
MERTEITVQTKGFPEAKFNYNLSENIEEAVAMFESKNVHDLFIRALTIAAQANARKMLSLGKTAETIQIEMDQWKPGFATTRNVIKSVDPVKVITENFDEWTPERQEEIFALIQARFAQRGMPKAEAPEAATEEEIAAVTEGMNGEPEVAPAPARRR